MVAGGGFNLALQLLKPSFFLLFLFLSILCLSPLKTSNEDIKIAEEIGVLESITQKDVPFKVGQEIKYNIAGYSEKDLEGIFGILYRLTGKKPYWMAVKGEKISEREDVYIVESLEEIENKSSYKVRLKINATVLKPSKEHSVIENLLYFDAATGTLLKAELGVDEPQSQILVGEEVEKYGIHPSPMFSPWMLELKKSFRIDNITIELVGMEKVLDRNCFKVKLEGSNYQAINWIDVDKRILVKGEYVLTNQNIRYEMQIGRAHV